MPTPIPIGAKKPRNIQMQKLPRCSIELVANYASVFDQERPVINGVDVKISAGDQVAVSPLLENTAASTCASLVNALIYLHLDKQR